MSELPQIRRGRELLYKIASEHVAPPQPTLKNSYAASSDQPAAPYEVVADPIMTGGVAVVGGQKSWNTK